MITVMGATGHTGKEIVRLLSGAGENVRAIGRSKSKLAELAGTGVEIVCGDASDSVFLTAAFQGTDAVYTLLPYDPQSMDYFAQQDQLGESILQAVQNANVTNIVFLSSVGADLPSGTGFISSMHTQEQRLRTLADRNVLVLRAGSFFENFYGVLDLVRYQGINADAIVPDVRLPMIATRDIATVAAEALRSRDWEGFMVRELLGPCDLSYTEATQMLGERIGKPELPYVQLPYEEMAGMLTQIGFSAEFARLHVELAHALNEGTIRSLETRTPTNTTPTLFEEFATEWAAAYQAVEKG